jgi:formate-dependent phosphoribosylglycinamide formyltransferase (GAR transformylase)
VTAQLESAGRRSVLLVGGADPVPASRDIAGDALHQARSRGLRTQVINRRDLLALSPGLFLAADQTSGVDPDDPADCLRWVEDRVAAGGRFDVVFGLRDSVLASVAAISTALGLPGNSPESVRRSQRRDECRATLATAGLPQPRFRACAGIADAEAFLAEVPGPWVVMPLAGRGKRLVREPAALPRAVAALPDPGGFLVEEFVDGRELYVEGVFANGVPHVLAVSEAETDGFVELARSLPADLPAGTLAEILDLTRRATAALGLRHGVCHVRLWLTAGGIVVGEVHPRPGDHWTHRLLAHAIPGLEMFGLVYDDQLTGAANGWLAPVRAAASRYLTPPPGRLVAVHGWDALLAHPCVLHAELFVRPGEKIPPTGPAGVVLVGANTRTTARNLATNLATSVRFETNPA